MVNGVESNSKLSHFEGVFCLDAALQVLYALPVFISELRIVVGQQCGSLEGSQIGMHERRRSMLSAVDEELHRLGPSIIRILNNFLRKKLCRYKCAIKIRVGYSYKLYRHTLKIWPSGYLSRIPFIVTDSGGRRCPKCCPVKGGLLLILPSPTA